MRPLDGGGDSEVMKKASAPSGNTICLIKGKLKPVSLFESKASVARAHINFVRANE